MCTCSAFLKKPILGIVTSLLLQGLLHGGCAPSLREARPANTRTPETYGASTSPDNSAKAKWSEFFADPHLISLIEEGLKNNQEVNIFVQEISIAKYEMMARQGEYLPKVGVGAVAGIEKVGRYTSQGANDANTDI